MQFTVLKDLSPLTKLPLILELIKMYALLVMYSLSEPNHATSFCIWDKQYCRSVALLPRLIKGFVLHSFGNIIYEPYHEKIGFLHM